MTFSLFLAIIAAGAAGALARAAVSTAVQTLWHRRGAGTLVVNLVGAVVLGAWLGAGERVDGAWLAIVGTGFLGAFTTFSTWMVELAERWRTGARVPALLEAGLTLVVGTALASLAAHLTSG